LANQLSNFLQTPNWARQYNWRGFVWRTMARLGLTGVHSLPVSRHWVEVHRRPMPMHNLDPAFNGFRIIQLSDLHYSPMVWKRYLSQFMTWVNAFKPDLVVVTGDLVTGGYRWSRDIANVLKDLRATHGVVCTFGNHDYSLYGRRNPAEGLRRAAHLEKSLKDAGLIVLRNQTLRIQHKQSKTPLTVVGLDDEWSGNINPAKAWAGVDAEEPILCLNHNPANADELLPYPWQWMLAGHTHGRQLGTSKVGSKLYGKLARRYVHGYYPVADRHLYVNRGLSYGQRVKRWCRPEVSVFRLRHAATTSATAAEDLPAL
jgi:uncharacterized protein